MEIDVMGAEWRIEWVDGLDGFLDDKTADVDALTLPSRRAIYIKRGIFRDWMDADERGRRLEEVTRHEIIHAFLSECGLDASSSPAAAWAENEEMVDWFALTWRRIDRAVEDALDQLWGLA